MPSHQALTCTLIWSCWASSRLSSPRSSSLSPYNRYFVVSFALFWTHYRISLCLFCWGAHHWTQLSRCVWLVPSPWQGSPTLITTVQCVKHHQIHGSVQWGHLLEQNSCVLMHISVPARAENWAASPSAAPVSRTPSQPRPSTAPPCCALLPKQEQSLPTRLVAEVGWGWDGYVRGNCSTSLIYISVHL